MRMDGKRSLEFIPWERWERMGPEVVEEMMRISRSRQEEKKKLRDPKNTSAQEGEM